jgi:hypothetical protein
MLMYQSNEHGCVYSIDNEGVLFYTPQYRDNHIELDDWSEVDHMALLGEDETIRRRVDEIHDKLIKANKSMGEYYQVVID